MSMVVEGAVRAKLCVRPRGGPNILRSGSEQLFECIINVLGERFFSKP